MSTLSVRVLLIEKSLPAARRLKKQLRTASFMQMDIIHARELEEAFASLSNEKFDVILLNLSRPGITGMDAIRRIHSSAPNIPVVGLISSGESAPGIDTFPNDMREFLIEEQDDPEAISFAVYYAISQQRRENALRENEEKLRLACDASHTMVYDIDARTGNLVFVHGLPGLLGYHPEEVPRKKEWWFEQIHAEDLPSVLNQMQEALVEGSNYALQYRLRHKDGTYIVVEDSGRNMLDERGRAIRSIGSVVDITKRTRIENALRQSQHLYHELVEELEKMVEQRTADLEKRRLQLRALAAELVHAEERERKRLAQAMHDDLQQLLVGAKFCAETLAGSVQKTSLKDAVHRLIQFLSDAIESARSLTFDLNPPILHGAGLAQSLDYLREQMKAKHGLIVNVRADEQAEPEADDIKVLLFQSARELLFNVVKHARIKTADLETRRFKEDFIQITVSDSGVGFDPKKCFKEGSRYGFGLFNIRERLDLIGGQLDIHSIPGSGSRCTITVPIAQCITVKQPGLEMERAPLIPTKPQGGLIRAGYRIRVLVTDNLSVVREQVIRLLEEHKDIAVVGEASDAQEALELARQVIPDVILMEVNMPRLDSIETVIRLRQELPQVRVIGLSSEKELEQGAAICQAGAFAVLDKNNRLETLVSTIRNAFESAA
jgi:PAS domain S-box-containing protein